MNDLRVEPVASGNGRRAAKVAAQVLTALLTVGAIGMVFPDLLARLAPPMLFYPEPLSEAEADPAVWGLAAAESVELETEDGVRLHGWWIPAATGTEPCGAAIFFHGNAGNIASRSPIGARLAGLGLSTLLVDYRGYGRSGGKPSEEGLYRDGRAAYRWVWERPGVTQGGLIVIGNSLGAAVATDVAASEETTGLVITGAFRSVPHMARSIYWWLPAGFFRWSRNRFDSEARMPDVSVPVLVGRGANDRLIPRAETRALYEAAAPPKRWVEVEGAGHNDLWLSEGLWMELERFLDSQLCTGRTAE
ncbi:MAG: alpha/beta hydrolase [Gemmatimonadetes bacterium]|nr:alpha/beta hydrolase [Gemmatimonadota bacterium]